MLCIYKFIYINSLCILMSLIFYSCSVVNGSPLSCGSGNEE
nr:MAG TPA: protein of unknown function (DUF4972) [Microviridae sp.]